MADDDDPGAQLHGEQLDEAAGLEYPGPQGMQLVAPIVATAYAPAKQLVHTPGSVAPASVAYAPEVQDVQADAPVSVEYMPATQTVQPLVPLDKLEYVPAAHAVQADGPEASVLYVPAEQAAHADAPGDPENDPTTQEVQATAPLDPALYFPAAHAVQYIDDDAAL